VRGCGSDNHLCNLATQNMILWRVFTAHTATRCNTLHQLQCTAIHCNTLEDTATQKGPQVQMSLQSTLQQYCNTHYNILQHCCNTPQHTTTHCNIKRTTSPDVSTVHTATVLQQTATHCNTLQRTATHCDTLQHTATHYTALQRTAKQRGPQVFSLLYSLSKYIQ
jgi:hypothetical protein